MKKLLLSIFLAVNIQAGDISPVVIDYFYEPGCVDCFRVQDYIMPELKDKYEGFYVLNSHDVGIQSNVVRLIEYQKHMGITKSESVSMYVDYEYACNGYGQIKTNLFRRIDECFAKRMAPGWKGLKPLTIPELPVHEMAKSRMQEFTVWAVIISGLADGINPCAIATLVFFMSLLSVSHIHGRKLLLVGISFCAASFATYVLIGFGVLRVFHVLKDFRYLRDAVDLSMMTFLCVASILSFRDAYRYSKSRNPNDVILKLPGRITTLMHIIMKKGLGMGSLMIGGVSIGIFVTALESVCTGQVYVPTLLLIIKSGGFSATAWNYLLLYNVMFIVPLVLVLSLAYLGLSSQRLLALSRRNVVVSKMLLGVLFVLLLAILVAIKFLP